jgi:hypothetical protein
MSSSSWNLSSISRMQRGMRPASPVTVLGWCYEHLQVGLHMSAYGRISILALQGRRVDCLVCRVRKGGGYVVAFGPGQGSQHSCFRD